MSAARYAANMRILHKCRRASAFSRCHAAAKLPQTTPSLLRRCHTGHTSTAHYGAYKLQHEEETIGELHAEERFQKMSCRSETATDHTLNAQKMLYLGQEKSFWKGLPLMKSAFCMTMYSNLIQEVRPRMIIETGAAMGASAVWWADHCKAALGDHFKGVIASDLSLANVDSEALKHPNIKWMEVRNAELHAHLRPELKSLPRPLIFVEDAHFELEPVLKFLHAELLQVGDYLIVEDAHPMHVEVCSEMGYFTNTDNESERVALDSKKKITRKFMLEHDDQYRVDTYYQDMFGINVGKTFNGIIKRVA